MYLKLTHGDDEETHGQAQSIYIKKDPRRLSIENRASTKSAKQVLYW